MLLRGIGMGIDQRIPDTRLGRQMDDASNGLLGEERGNSGTIRQVQFGESKLGVRQEFRQPCFFQTNIVVVIKIVQPEHGIAAIEQPLGDMRPDKAGRAGDEH